MKWHSWGLYAILALVLTVAASQIVFIPGEKTALGLFSSLPSFGGLWTALNTLMETQWLLGTVILLSALSIYFFLLPRDVVIPLAGVAGAIVIEWIVRPLVERPGPGLIAAYAGKVGSFPSGAALLYACWLGAITIVCYRRVRTVLTRRIIEAALIGTVVLGGVAQLQAGAHWPTDVLGSWLWAAAWVLWLYHATRQIS